MNAFILDPGSPASCQPLTCTRPLAAFPVANRPLREHQEALLRDAGLRPVAERAAAKVFLAGNAWLDGATLAALAVAAGPAVVRDAQGHLLAWANPGGDDPQRAEAIPAIPECFAIVYPWDLLRLNELLVGALVADAIQGRVSPGVTVEGHLALGEGSRLLPGVFIEGNVVIGKNCKIGPNCYLRGNTSIGDGCHVGNGVEIKNSILLAKASVGHLSYCGDSIIGEGCNWGAGTIVGNLRHDGANHRSQVGGALVDTGRRKFGTVMGDDVHTGIHTAIYPGRKFWPHASTRPGEIVSRDLTG
ncbi:MAG: DapH/DapD/GlmU-related protein [Lentisphaeria bacterium]|jgi:bifunctional UDP-N-acetylglucosamine pyrophosphorylase/glucosamine-1-phosphate N-acetyltransferase